MKASINTFLLIIATVGLTACKKESGTNPAPKPVVIGEYVEFSIDGKKHSIIGSSSGNTLIADGTAQLADFGFQKLIVFRFLRMDPLEMVGFAVSDVNYPAVNYYPVSAADHQTIPYNHSDFAFIMENGNQYTYTLSTTGGFELTKSDSVIGGVVEGSFFLTNLNLTDEDGNIISSGHTLKNGKFRAVIQ